MASADAQRLIALSLGKIAGSRGQRGGINLHKNLLVAGVLQKARTVIMIDNYNLMMQNRAKEASVVSSVTDNAKLVPKENSQGISRPTETGNNAGGEGHLNRPATPLGETQESNVEVSSSTNTEKTEDISRVQEVVDMSDKENSSPNCLKNSKCSKENETVNKDTSGQSCLRCVKRRHMDSTNGNVVDCSEKTTESNVTVAAKRPKIDTKTENAKSEGASPCQEPMQTESPQISNLVACFNTGFTGLLSHVGSSDSAHSQESTISSCATQLKSGFPSVSAPVLALSV